VTDEPGRRRERRAPAVSREVVLTLDDFERKIVWFLVAIGGLFTSIVLYYALIVGHETLTATGKPVNGKCPPLKGYEKSSLVNNVCHYTHVTPLSQLLLLAGLLGVMTLALAFFNYRRRRAGVLFLCFGLFLVMTSINGIVALIFLGVGVWYLVRAWRLQRYGTASARGVAEASRSRAIEKKSSGATKATTKPDEPTPRKPAGASKRYTPKKPVKKRR
jgi:hypothetical protein